MRLVPYARHSGRLLFFSFILLFPLAIAGAVQPILVGQAISLIQGEPTFALIADRSLQGGLNILALLLLGTIVVRLAFRGVQGYMVQEVGQQVTAGIRNDLFDHVTALAVGFYDRTPVGKLITRLTSDVEALGDVFSTGAIGIVSDLFSLLMVVAAMFLLQWQLALMLVLMLLPVTFLIIYFQHQYRQANYKAREELSQLNAAIQENILGIGVVQLFRRERFNAEQFRVTNQRYIKEVDTTIFHDSAISATLEWISLGAIVGVLWWGSILVSQKVLTVGTLASFILFSQRVFDPLRQLAEKFTAIQSGLTAVERIADLLDEPIEIQDPEHHLVQELTKSRVTDLPVDGHRDNSHRDNGHQDNGHQDSSNSFNPGQSKIQIPSATPSSPDGSQSLGQQRTGEIRFEQVWFGYKPDEYVLKDLDFTIQPGEKVALVGPTGAGKSSIIRLLCRLYEPSQGRVLVDGLDVRRLPQQALRQHIGVILQDGFLFAGDVKSNIALGESYSFAEIETAAQRTNVAAFIEQLPQNYHTQLRQRGTNLSAGQKQLLAFARVAVRNPEILVLDEATANLDVQTEALIQEALERLLVDRTAIIIAHRLSTIRNVDRILVLKRGQLVESGTHDALLAQGGLYASLYQLQMLGTA
jgi:ATP-binding cassette subfamily B protein